MSTPAKPANKTQTPPPPATKTTTTTTKVKKAPDAPRGNQTFLFTRDNYNWMIGGVVLILLGFALMSGGKSANPHEFHYDEIYSFRRVTLAPVILLLGFVVEIFAIMKKPKEQAAV
jgi:hypothetical protein